MAQKLTMTPAEFNARADKYADELRPMIFKYLEGFPVDSFNENAMCLLGALMGINLSLCHAMTPKEMDTYEFAVDCLNEFWIENADELMAHVESAKIPH